jgi:hypothetical protein
MWLNNETDNIKLAVFSVHRQDRAATSGKTRGGGVFLFVNNCWCAMSNIKEVLRYCSPEVEYLMISCRPHYLQREFSSILFVAIYLPPQTDAGTKTTINELYKAISKQVNAHPEAAQGTGDFNADKLISVLTFLPACHMCNQREKKL